MNGFHSSNYFFPGDMTTTSTSYLSSFLDETREWFGMWPERSAAAVLASQTGDYSAWDVAALEARIAGSSWKEPTATASRIQDIALEITDHQPKNTNCRGTVDEGGGESSLRWPYDHSPCRLFGSRRHRKRNSMGELALHRSCTSLPVSVEFGLATTTRAPPDDEFRQPHNEGWSLSASTSSSRLDHRYYQQYDNESRDAPTPGGGGCNNHKMMVGRHRSFDEIEPTTTVSHRAQRQPPPPPSDRPNLHRGMSIDDVQPPDHLATTTSTSSSSPSKRRRGRRPVSQPLTEEVVDDEQKRAVVSPPSTRPPHRDLLMLLRDKEPIREEDLQFSENRRLLHCLVYQQKLSVCFQDLVDHVQEDIENDPEEAFLRPPIPMFLDC